MHRTLRIIWTALLTPALAGSSLAGQDREILLATTTSTADTGLLDSLLPMFQRETGIAVKPIAVGTGAALEMARRGEADAVLVHAPEVERIYVQSGDLIEGRRVMYNDFLIIGPAADPAGLKGKPLVEAMKALATRGSFVSRGDGSGTETKELALWKAAGIRPASLERREETGQGMGPTLLIAEQRQTYTLTDRATFLAFKDRLTLVPLVEGDPVLRNLYSVYAVNPGKHPAAKRAEALRFVRYLTRPEVQAWIGQFGTDRWGEPLFRPNAEVSAVPQEAAEGRALAEKALERLAWVLRPSTSSPAGAPRRSAVPEAAKGMRGGVGAAGWSCSCGRHQPIGEVPDKIF